MMKPQAQIKVLTFVLALSFAWSFSMKRCKYLKHFPSANPGPGMLLGPSLQNRYEAEIKLNKGFQQYQRGYKVQEDLSFRLGDSDLCTCGSNRSYLECCKPIHQNYSHISNVLPESMFRARYTAYQLGLADFVIKISARDSKEFQYYAIDTFSNGIKRWRKQIKKLSSSYEYYGMKILNTEWSFDNLTVINFVVLTVWPPQHHYVVGLCVG
jgi:uncharacterized protein YchJ